MRESRCEREFCSLISFHSGRMLEFFESVIDCKTFESDPTPLSIAEIRKSVIFENNCPAVLTHLMRIIVWISNNFETFSDHLFQRSEIQGESDLVKMKAKTDFLFRLKDLELASGFIRIGSFLFCVPSLSPVEVPSLAQWPLETGEEICSLYENVRILVKEDQFRNGLQLTASSSSTTTSPSRMIMWGTSGTLAVSMKSLFLSNSYFSFQRILVFQVTAIQQVCSFF